MLHQIERYYIMKKLTARGFTLIELLIVIALLGALAIGLLATIDPFEQLKKGRDTSTRNTTLEFYNAELRYYSTKGKFTWPTAAATTNTVDKMTGDLTALIEAGELKNQFYQLAGSGNLAKIYINSTSPTHLAVCYQPESKSFQVDPATIYNSVGSTAGMAGCKSQTSSGGTDCFYCVQ